MKAPMTTSSVWTIIKGDAKSVRDNLADKLKTTSETLETIDKYGKLISSGWAIKSFSTNKPFDICETMPMSGSSYIPTPENTRIQCADLSASKGVDDKLCVHWCFKMTPTSDGPS